MTFTSPWRGLLALGLFSTFSPLSAQDPQAAASQSGRPNVFFDCQGFNCNDQFYRTEIDWVNWIRVPEESQVHVIMTSQMTGAGGREYQLDFIGRGASEAYGDQIRIQSASTDTQVEQLDAVANALGVGLARFAAVTGYRGLVRLEGQAQAQSAGGLVTSDQVADPWNLWSFRLNGNTNIDGESTQKNVRFNGGFSANRVTPTWKMNFFGGFNFNRREIEQSDSSLFIDENVGWNFNPLVVYSIADHWSVGLRGMVGRMRQVNQRVFVELTPALEYSFFPYDEATRRSLTAFYTIGPRYRDYFEETLLGESAETRMEETLSVEFSQRQPWGDARISTQVEHFLHDIGKYRASVDANVSFRVTRGFNVNANGNVASVKNQIYLSADGETDEEALLNLRQRATSYEYGFSVGFSFQFGSIFNNVVNNRFPGGGGGGGGFGGGFGGGGGGGGGGG